MMTLRNVMPNTVTNPIAAASETVSPAIQTAAMPRPEQAKHSPAAGQQVVAVAAQSPEGQQ
jgi:hypothetical protein